MNKATANDLAAMKRAINFLLKRGPHTPRAMDATLTLVEDLCAVIRQQEQIPKGRLDDEPTVSVCAGRNCLGSQQGGQR